MVTFRTMTLDHYERTHTIFELLFAFHMSPFGKCLVAVTDTDKAVAYLGFVDNSEEEALYALRQRWPLTLFTVDIFNETKRIVEATFYGNPSLLGYVCVLLKGTEFETDVWKALTTIPRGTSTTYEEVARMINKPRSIRAVAKAIAKNCISCLVPCHRVKGKTGTNEYKWGVERKEAILKFEKEYAEGHDYTNS